MPSKPRIVNNPWLEVNLGETDNEEDIVESSREVMEEGNQVITNIRY